MLTCYSLTEDTRSTMDYEPIQQPNGADLAPQACSSCRKQKRKCDKQLPACSLCQRIGRICDYSADSHATLPSPEEFAALRDQVTNLEQLLRSTAQNSNGSLLSSNGSAATPNGSNSNGSITGSLNLSSGSSPAALPTPGQSSMYPNPAAFPSLFFLDSNAFEYERFQIQAPYTTTSPSLARYDCISILPILFTSQEPTLRFCSLQ
jgi:hypothetical protein